MPRNFYTPSRYVYTRAEPLQPLLWGVLWGEIIHEKSGVVDRTTATRSVVNITGQATSCGF